MGYGWTREFDFKYRTSRHCELCFYDVTDLEDELTCPFCDYRLIPPKFKIRPLGSGLVVPDATACLNCRYGAAADFCIAPYKVPDVTNQPRRKKRNFWISLFRQVPPPEFELLSPPKPYRRRESSQDVDSELWNSLDGSTRLDDSFQESSTMENSQNESRRPDVETQKSKREGNAEDVHQVTMQGEGPSEEASVDGDDEDDDNGDGEAPKWVPPRMDALPKRPSMKGVLKKDPPPKQGLLSKLTPLKVSRKEGRGSQAFTRCGKSVTFADELSLDPPGASTETCAQTLPSPPDSPSAELRVSLLQRVKLYGQVRVERQIRTPQPGYLADIV